MANFDSSVLVAGQAMFTDQMTSAEWRLPDSAAIKTANMGVIANPDLASLKTGSVRSVTAKFPIRQAAIGGTVRVAEHTGARGDSSTETISWSKFVEPFSISLKQADNNVMNWAQMYAATKRNAVLNLINRLDAWFVTQLLADKTQQNVGGANGTFTAGFNYEVTSTSANTFYSEVKTMMEQNLYRNQLMGIVDAKGYQLYLEKTTQGAGNANNLAWTVNGFQSIVPTTRTILGGTYNGSGLFFEPGLVAVTAWVPPANRKSLNPDKAWTRNGDFGQLSIPEIGIDMAQSNYATRADTSSAGGDEQDMVLQEELSVEVGYVSAPLSSYRGANDSVVYAAGLVS